MRLSLPRAFLAPALLGSAAAVISACGGSEQPGSPQPAKAGLTRCSDLPGVPSASCGSIVVPLDRGDPAAGTTTVAFALLPRRNRAAPAAGTILFNPGGPGDAPTAHAGDIAKQFAPLLDTRDLLLIDPRGTGRSAPLRCRAFADRGLAGVFAARSAEARSIGACGRELGSRAARYGSAEVADDFDAVREVLGLDRLDLWGNSYGAYLMPVYAARHPKHVRSIVLSSAYPMKFDPFGRDRLDTAREALRVVCARTRSCRGDVVLRDLAALATRLRRHPVSFSVPVGEQRFRTPLDEQVLAPLLYTAGNEYTFGELPALAASGAAGDLAPLRRVVESALLRNAYSALHEPAGSDGLAQAFATMCHDYPQAFSPADAPAARHAAYDKALSAIDPGAFFPLSAAAWTTAGFEGGAACIEWPADATAAPPLAPTAPMPDVPVLVLSGQLDANTPSSAGREVAGQFAHSTFAEIPNAGHVPTDRSPCALELALRFVATTTADANACAGTGTPPPVGPRAALRTADLPRVLGATGTPAQRRTLAVIVATAADLQVQTGFLDVYKSASGLRGGRYVARGKRVGLASVRVVRDAKASGELNRTASGVTGTLRLTGRAIASGRLRIRLTSKGRGDATGTLDGRPVRLGFRFGAAK
jgi:pimeloyl-ACP methyl ester carboxylesterase